MAHIIPSRVKHAENERNVWRLKAETEQDLDFFKDPKAWAHAAVLLRAGDKVEILAADRTWYAQGIVLSVKTAWAQIGFYIYEQFDAQDATDDKKAPYTAKFRGRAAWCVVRNADGEIVETNLQTKAEANAKISILLKETA